MLTVEGVYKNGKVELLETVPAFADSKVLVTFLNNSDISLRTLDIDEAESAELREKLATFDDWNDPALDIYNDYDKPNPPSAKGHKRGDVVLVPFPNSDLQTAKLRPAMIVQADDLNTGIPQIIIAMISSKSYASVS